MTYNTNTVRIFSSGQAGAPTLSGSSGSLVNVIRQCMRGYNTKVVDSITVVGTTMTILWTTAGGTGYGQDAVVKISGATEPEFNDYFRVTSTATNTTICTVPATFSPSATGTISIMQAGLDWEELFPDVSTTRALFRSKDPTSTKIILRVEDAGSLWAPTWNGSYSSTIVGSGYMSGWFQSLEEATDINTLYRAGIARPVLKSHRQDAGGRGWYLIGDGKRFFFFTDWQNWGRYTPHFAGDINSHRPNDQFHFMISGNTNDYSYMSSTAVNIDSDFPNQSYYTSSFSRMGHMFSTGAYAVADRGMFLQRSQSQMNGWAYAWLIGGNAGSWGNPNSIYTNDYLNTSRSGVGQYLPFPNPANNGLYISPVLVGEYSSSYSIRGSMPGYYNAMSSVWTSGVSAYRGMTIDGSSKIGYVFPLNDFFYDTNVSAAKLQTKMFIDIIGPW